MNSNQKLPRAAKFLDVIGATPPDAREDQKDNTGTAPVNPNARPQTPGPTANSQGFQPSPVNNLGDMVSDFQASEPVNPGAEDTFPASLGGSSILVAGADHAVATPNPTPTVRGL